jgi:hypothetical protein
MDEGGPFHSRLEERLDEIAAERRNDLETFATRLDEALQTVREEGVSRADVESLLGERLDALEKSLRDGMVSAAAVDAMVEKRTATAVDTIRGELAREIEGKVAGLVENAAAQERDRIDSRIGELAETAGPSAEDLRAAAADALEKKLPAFRDSLATELEERIGKQPVGDEARQAIADAVETRMRDSLSEDSDIYENLVGNLTGQLERVIREGMEKLERKKVSHEDWNVMAARLRQELTTKIENEAARAAAQIIREEISSLLGEE